MLTDYLYQISEDGSMKKPEHVMHNFLEFLYNYYSIL